MKKNNVMRVFALMLALTLISVCAISGTFAKYVTRASGEDQARVAKWGVILGVKGNAFATQYKTHETGDNKYPGAYSVVSAEEDQVVAPGTSSADVGEGKGMIATVFGTPEVATRYTLHIASFKDVILPAGTYTDYTQLVKNDDGEWGYFNTFNLATDYTPVKWDIEVKNEAGTSYKLTEVAAEYGVVVDGFSFSDAASIMQAQDIMNRLLPRLQGMASGASNAQCTVTADGIDVSMDFDPNTEMDYTFTLTWKWAFEGNDQADTYLGNVAANALVDYNVADTQGEVSVNLSAALTASATQID